MKNNRKILPEYRTKKWDKITWNFAWNTFIPNSHDPAVDCHEWTGNSDSKKPYGRFYFDNKSVLAHRFAWEIFNGPIPAGKHVCHTCKNPSCVNIDHLYLSDKAPRYGSKFSQSKKQQPQTME